MSHPAGVFHRAQGAAAALPPVSHGQVRRPQLHRDADDVVPFPTQQGRSDAAVHASAHGDDDPRRLGRLRLSTPLQAAARRTSGLRLRPTNAAHFHWSPTFPECVEARRSRSRSTMAAKHSAAGSNSSSWLAHPRLRRKAPAAASLDKPMASRTWDGSNDPDVQAEPLAAATPCKSKFKSSDSASTPSMTRWTMPGTRRPGVPLRRSEEHTSELQSREKLV